MATWLLFSFYGSRTEAAAPVGADTLQLQTVEVQVSRLPSGMTMGRTGRVQLDAQSVRRGFRVLGEADALKQLQMLPGFTAAGDYGSGVAVDGAHFSQTSTTLDGVTIFFPYHFGGVFSTFNSAALSRLDVSRVSGRAVAPLRLAGAMLASTPDSLVTSPQGEVSLGLIAASASVALPAGHKVTVRAAVRQSFLDLIYGTMLDTDDTALRYSFTDANMGATWHINERNRFTASAYCNFDRLKFADTNYGLDARMKWGNAAALLRYEHEGEEWSLRQTAAYSRFANKVELLLPQLVCALPSAVEQWMSLTSVRLGRPQLDIDLRNELDRLSPQHGHCTGVVAFDNEGSRITAGTSALSLHRAFRLGDSFLLEGTARASLVVGEGRCFFEADPLVSASYFRGPSVVTAEAFTSTQDLHLVGFSDIGLSTDFWLPSSRRLPPQRAYGGALSYMLNGRRFTPSVRIFYKRLRHVAEYTGDVLSLLADDYTPEDMTQSLDGFNAGVDATLLFRLGRFSGWAGYSLAYCRLRYPQAGGRLLPSSTEPLNQLKVTAAWQLSRTLTLGAFFCLASGRPYTAIKNAYIMAGNVMAQYGEPNSARLPAYHRLDLSATWQCTPRVLLNFSLVNAYGRRNVEMRYFTYDAAKATIGIDQTYSLYRFLPSVSCSYRF